MINIDQYNKRKVLAFTSIRSDYDLMSNLYSMLNGDDQIDFQILVSGAHLSKTYGYSVDNIEKDGFNIICKIESLIDSDSKESRLKTASIFLQNSIDIVKKFDPDVILYAGDREDVMMGALIGGYLEIPTIHFFGGDHVQDGNIDNPVRHAISKLSSLHFTSHISHSERLVKMGENPNSIKLIGSIALEKFIKHKPLTKNDLKKYFNISKGFKNFALLIFHPILEEKEFAYKQFENILKVLIQNNINTFISYPNTDAGNKKIIEVIVQHENHHNFFVYKNLDRDIFLSIFKNSDFLIGNSSAGITEAASIPIPVINVGKRQVGRFADENVTFCSANIPDIRNAIIRINSSDFKLKMKKVKNSYDLGNSCQKALELIKRLDFNKYLYKKWDPLNE